jgi:signal transduction histidine kinase
VNLRFAPKGGYPLAVQIIVLLLSVLVLGQAATVLAVLLLPPPRPTIYRVEDVAAALRGDEPGARGAARLVVETRSAPPDLQATEGARERLLAHELARLLGAEDRAVHVRIDAPPLFALAFSAHGPPGRRRWRPSSEPFSGQRAGDGPAIPAGPGPPVGFIVDGFPLRPAGDPQRVDRLGLVVGRFEAAFETRKGVWLVAAPPKEPFPNAWQTRMLAWFAACLVALLPMGYIFARRLTAPLGRFAAAARRLGRDPHAPPLAVGGPAEIGAAAAALNDMQARLARYVQDRTAMLGAVAHDLRTPLARVQFKLQRAAPGLAADIRADIAQMEGMISAVLAFVRDVAPAHERTPLDLRSLLEVVADDAAATGAEAALAEGGAVIVDGDAGALVRLFANLVDNAVKYGNRARISLRSDEEEVLVTVEDDGPGVPADALERVFEPFERLETSRSRDTGGIGLGLSVARSIARAHGGEAVLCNRPGGGAMAVVRLPLSAAAQQAAPVRASETFSIRHSEDIAV